MFGEALLLCVHQNILIFNRLYVNFVQNPKIANDNPQKQVSPVHVSTTQIPCQGKADATRSSHKPSNYEQVIMQLSKTFTLPTPLQLRLHWTPLKSQHWPDTTACTVTCVHKRVPQSQGRVPSQVWKSPHSQLKPCQWTRAWPSLTLLHRVLSTSTTIATTQFPFPHVTIEAAIHRKSFFHFSLLPALAQLSWTW